MSVFVNLEEYLEKCSKKTLAELIILQFWVSLHVEI